MDILDFIIIFESGESTGEQTIQGFQELIDTGMAWKLQGTYGRMATKLIELGYCHKTNKEIAEKLDDILADYD